MSRKKSTVKKLISCFNDLTDGGFPEEYASLFKRLLLVEVDDEEYAFWGKWFTTWEAIQLESYALAEDGLRAISQQKEPWKWIVALFAKRWE